LIAISIIQLVAYATTFVYDLSLMNRQALRIHRNGSNDGSADGDSLRRLVHTFVRSIGLLSADRTPCGKPLAASHAHALMVLLEHSRGARRPTQQELGRALGIDKSNVARLCRKMEQTGHLTQERCPDDGRARLLSLTDRGTRAGRNVERSSRARFHDLIAAVPPRSRASVLSALAALNEALLKSKRGSSKARKRGGGQSS
jgi:DNA-binding MarR family transcriptional regulator